MKITSKTSYPTIMSLKEFFIYIIFLRLLENYGNFTEGYKKSEILISRLMEFNESTLKNFIMNL